MSTLHRSYLRKASTCSHLLHSPTGREPLYLGRPRGCLQVKTVVWFVQLSKGWYSEDVCSDSMDWGPGDPRQVGRKSTVMWTVAEYLLPNSLPLLSDPLETEVDWC